LAQTATAEARVQLAPSGKLRVAFVMFEPGLVTRDVAGDPIGVAPDLARALAEPLGLPIEPILYDSPATYAASVGSFRWDIAYIADFVRAAKASGFIQKSIDRAGVAGVRVAPP